MATLESRPRAAYWRLERGGNRGPRGVQRGLLHPHDIALMLGTDQEPAPSCLLHGGGGRTCGVPLTAKRPGG